MPRKHACTRINTYTQEATRGTCWNYDLINHLLDFEVGVQTRSEEKPPIGIIRRQTELLQGVWFHYYDNHYSATGSNNLVFPQL